MPHPLRPRFQVLKKQNAQATLSGGGAYTQLVSKKATPKVVPLYVKKYLMGVLPYG